MLRRRLLQRFFALLYTRLAWAYDGVAWLVSAGQWYRWAHLALDYVESGPVLELGCGRGRLLGPMAARGWHVVGVDQSAEMAREAGRGGVPVVRADGRALPFADGHFGTVVTIFPASYILEPQTQREIARVTRGGGRWIWVDQPQLDREAPTMLARLVARLATGAADVPLGGATMLKDWSGGRWEVGFDRVAHRHATLLLRLARRR